MMGCRSDDTTELIVGFGWDVHRHEPSLMVRSLMGEIEPSQKGPMDAHVIRYGRLLYNKKAAQKDCTPVSS